MPWNFAEYFDCRKRDEIRLHGVLIVKLCSIFLTACLAGKVNFRKWNDEQQSVWNGCIFKWCLRREHIFRNWRDLFDIYMLVTNSVFLISVLTGQYCGLCHLNIARPYFSSFFEAQNISVYLEVHPCALIHSQSESTQLWVEGLCTQ